MGLTTNFRCIHMFDIYVSILDFNGYIELILFVGISTSKINKNMLIAILCRQSVNLKTYSVDIFATNKGIEINSK